MKKPLRNSGDGTGASPLQALKITALEATANAVVITDTRGEFLWVNRAFTILTGYTMEEVVGKTPNILKSGMQDDAFYRQLWATVARGETWRGVMINRRKDGSHYYQDFTITPVIGAEKTVTHYIGVSQDVSEQIRLREDLERSRTRIAAILAESDDLILLVDASGLVLDVLETAGKRAGMPHPVVGQTIFEGMHPDDVPMIEAKRELIVKTPGRTLRGEFRLKRPDGGWSWIETVGTNLLHDPHVRAIVVHRRDVSDRKEAEELIRHQATHDHLTGLPNRTLILDRLAVALEYAKRGEASPALLFFDLDEFKPVNDQHGHAAGDDVLRVVADRLRGIVRASDTIGRWGGDEFILLLAGSSTREGDEMVARAAVDALLKPITHEGVTLHIGVSVGIARWPEHGTTARELLASADSALYVSKTTGMNTITFADESADGPRRGDARGASEARGRRPSTPRQPPRR